MKNQKKFILVFATFWVLGLVGGYYLGVGSGLLPNENIEYNYYFSENTNNSSVESIEKSCSENFEKEDNSTIEVLMKSLNFQSIPQKVIRHLFSPSACNEKKLKKAQNQELA
jgi:hypothetical protein